MKEIKSFARRCGRALSSNQSNLLSNNIPNLNKNTGVIFGDIITIPDNKYEQICLEIGFGHGDHLHGRAKKNTSNLYFGSEPYLNGVVSLAAKIEKSNLSNIYVWHDDVHLLLSKLEDNILDCIYVLYPDPWHKSKHKKRRIINENFLKILYSKLKPTGKLIIATDHAEYAKWILLTVLNNENYFTTANNIEDFINFPEDWIKTKYQMKADLINSQSFYMEFFVNKTTCDLS